MLRQMRRVSRVSVSVQEYYGKVLQSSKDLKTNACTASGAPHPIIRKAIENVPNEVTSRFYGCGMPVPLGIDGKDVLDLGSGSGRDAYVAAALVGPEGSVLGVDMTKEQIDIAAEHADKYTLNTLAYPQSNLSFRHGYIENLADAGVAPESIDLAISNCVVNLSPHKASVIQGVYQALREGGEFYFSDVYADRRIPKDVQEDEVLWGECLSGALYVEDFKRICHSVGFTDPRELSRDPIEVGDEVLREKLGPINFYSITYRCFKIPGLETKCEDYGQCVRYLGTIPGMQDAYILDHDHTFETGRCVPVCCNTSFMVGKTWLAPHFETFGDLKHHFGLFDGCGTPSTPPDRPSAEENLDSIFPAKPTSGCC